MLKKIELNDQTIHGTISLEQKGAYLQPWRINFEEKELFTPDQLNGQAEVPAGVRISFVSNTDKLKLEVAPNQFSLEFDILIDDEYFQTVPLDANESKLVVTGLSSRNKKIEIYLSQREKLQLKELWIDEAASWQPYRDNRKKWITYGSSITQCHAAESPSQTWPAITAKKLDLNLICLGYSGQCQYEPMVARLIRDTPTDLISLKASINSYNASCYSPRTFKSIVLGFIKIIREKQNHVPIVLSSAIYGAEREETENTAGFTLRQMRSEVKEIVNILKRNGDTNIFYVNGLDILGEKDHLLLPDHLHPNAEGYKLMGDKFTNALKPFIQSCH